MQKCHKCNIEKEESEFYKNRKTCKICHCNWSRNHYAKNAIRIRARKNAYNLRTYNPLADYIRKIKHRYGVTLEWYKNKLQEQNGCCEICKQPPKQGKRLFVDHNHGTGKVRGLLCNHCNSMIAYALEMTNNLQKAIEYLQKYN